MKNKLFVAGVIIGGLVLFGLLYLQSPRTAPTPKVETQTFSMAPLYRSNNQTYGNQSAEVVVVEFFDPECEACRQVHPIMKSLIKEYGNRVKFVYRYMPLHGGSMYASVALEEARELNKFDEALDILFERQPVWGDHGNPRPDLVPAFLQEIGIPKDKLGEEYLMNKHGAKVKLDQEDGRANGVRYTPTIFVGRSALSQIGEGAIRSAIEEALKENQK